MKNNNSHYLAISITICTLFIFILFAYAGNHWHFYKEEIDLFLDASHVKNVKDLFDFFLTGNTSGNAHPSNYQPNQLNFLNSFYRPILFIVSYVQFKCFGMNGYLYYLTAIFLHLFNALLLFILLKKYVTTVLASLLMLFFIFHPAFALWIGNANMQQYLLSTTGILLISMLLEKYFERKTFFILLSVNLIYLSTLFLRETIIALPCALIWLLIIEKVTRQHTQQKLPLLWPIISTMVSSSIYIIIKQINFPLSVTGTNSFTNFSASYSLYGLQGIIFLQDFLSASWFPYGKPMLKIFILGTLLMYLVVRFLKSTYKREIIFFAGLFVLFLWPAVLIGYFVPSRYFYEAAPCYIFMLAYLFKNIQHEKVYITSLFGIFIIINTCYTIQTIKSRQIEPTQFYHAVKKLPYMSPGIKTNPICFFGLTESLCWTGLAQQLWLYEINHNYPIYLFQQLEIHPQNISAAKYISIKRDKNSFVFSSLDKAKAWFLINHEYKTIDDVYGFISTNTTEDNKITQLRVTPKKNYFHPNTIFVTWNYTNNEFFVFPPVPSTNTAGLPENTRPSFSKAAGSF